MIRISVIIVNYNARYFLKNCLDSILSSDISDEIEIIVIDNASSDGSSDMIELEFPEILCLKNDENVGFGKANNKAVKLAKGEYVLILNPDTMMAENTLSEVLDFAKNQKDFGAVGVHFIDGLGNYLPESKRNFPNLKVAGAKLLGYSKYYYANQIEDNDIAEVEVLTGAFMFIKRAVYYIVEGFDEDFFMYGEDIDLSYRIFKAGYKNYYLGTSKVVHFKGESTVKNKFYFENFYGALGIFYKKHFHNSFGSYRIVDGLIKGMISINSLNGTLIRSEKLQIVDWLYVGDDKLLLEGLKTLFTNSKNYDICQFDDEIPSCQIVFLDSKAGTYSQIIEIISKTELRQVKKRILSQDHKFYLGSDSSNHRGEVVQI